MASVHLRGVRGARAPGANAAWARAALVVAAGCGGRHAAVERPECPTERIRAAPVTRSAVAITPLDAGPPSLPRRFYVAVAGRCSEWIVADGLARTARQGPLGEVVLEVKVRSGSAGPAVGEHYRRIGPLERIQDRLEALACYPCFLERDPMVARAWQDCAPVRPARWYADLRDCTHEAALLEGLPDASPRAGWEFHNGVTCELSEEGARARDEEDRAAYDATNQQLEAALATAKKRLLSFQTALSHTRSVFVRRGEGCEAWDLRQDADSPSGWNLTAGPARLGRPSALRVSICSRPRRGPPDGLDSNADSVPGSGEQRDSLRSAVRVVDDPDRRGGGSREVHRPGVVLLSRRM